MNNLLRTLTEIQDKSAQPPDLKLLLTTVKEARRQTLENKLADPFYESLEGLLFDLRTVTIDNRDAEAFLKPVSKTEYPDYYDIIATPMDLQTMLKKVKSKGYKSKREFQDDLELIWSNCFLYNATENHPLRLCVMRLKAKAERLLKYVTDRKDRADPHIPGDIVARGVTPKVNGTTSNSVIPGVARPRIQPSKSPSPMKLFSETDGHSKKDVPFPESSAILRTQAGMTAFRQLDQELDMRLANMKLENGHQDWELSLEDRLKVYVGTVAEADVDGESGDASQEGEVGEKRKLNGFVDNRPRKRARTSSEDVDKDAVELWWDALRSDDLIGNGLPTLRYASSDPPPVASSSRVVLDPQHSQAGRPRKRRKKKADIAQPGTLLYHMNNNIKTMRKVRTTHAKFAALNLTTNEDGTLQPSADFVPPPAVEDEEEAIDERPWRAKGSGIDIGAENADECLHWAGSKILEHAGFQGTSKAALDVLAGVTSDYLLNVGRTIRFLADKHANTMTAEEIILHTLFESGTAKIAELDHYVKDDVVRYGTRLSELEKKLANAYSEATTVEAWDDDALFNMEDEEQDGEFVMGNFADSFGDDFLGLRELGIAAEFGLSSLSIPKKLLKGKNKGKLEGPSTAKPSEPPLPFPLPPPFVPIDSENVENQIGLLRPYYAERISKLEAQQVPLKPLPPYFVPDATGPIGFGYPTPVPYPPTPPHQPVNLPVVLPDDPPDPAHMKLGPLGQVLKTAPAGGSKKKSKAKPKAEGTESAIPGVVPDGFEAGLETPVMTPFSHLPSESPKKPKGGTGSGKKKAKAVDPPLPPVVMASA